MEEQDRQALVIMGVMFSLVFKLKSLLVTSPYVLSNKCFLEWFRLPVSRNNIRYRIYVMVCFVELVMNLPTVLPPPPSVISSPSPSSDWIDRVSGVLLFFQRKLRNGDLLRVSDFPRCFSLAVLLRRDPSAVSYDYICLIRHLKRQY